MEGKEAVKLSISPVSSALLRILVVEAVTELGGKDITISPRLFIKQESLYTLRLKCSSSYDSA